MGNSINEKLAATRNLLFNEINLLNYEDLNRKPNTDTWSVAQICHHLYLTEIAFTNAIIYGYKRNDSRKAESKPIQLISDRSHKVNAPDMVVPGNGPFLLQEITDLLNRSRNNFLEFYRQIEDKSILAEKSVKHPLFGYLPLNQWVELLYLHDDRHIQQIKEIKEKMSI